MLLERGPSRKLELLRGQFPLTGEDSSKFQVDQAVEANWQMSGQWYSGRISGTYGGWLRHSPRITFFVSPNSIQIVNLSTFYELKVSPGLSAG
jgi:hypothetical protein